MRTVLFILGGKVAQNKPAAHFELRINAAIEYYKQHSSTEEISFVVSGRWTNVTDAFELTEAEVGKRAIISNIPEAVVYKEDISVELIGNYAFSKPIIEALKPDSVVIFTSNLLLKRNRTIGQRVFANHTLLKYEMITEELSDNEVLTTKEESAIKLFNNLFADVESGDDAAFRNILLYSTPYYFKGIVDDKEYFDTYWDGGYDRYLNALNVRNKS